MSFINQLRKQSSEKFSEFLKTPKSIVIIGVTTLIALGLGIYNYVKQQKKRENVEVGASRGIFMGELPPVLDFKSLIAQVGGLFVAAMLVVYGLYYVDKKHVRQSYYASPSVGTAFQ